MLSYGLLGSFGSLTSEDISQLYRTHKYAEHLEPGWAHFTYLRRNPEWLLKIILILMKSECYKSVVSCKDLRTPKYLVILQDSPKPANENMISLLSHPCSSANQVPRCSSYIWDQEPTIHNFLELANFTKRKLISFFVPQPRELTYSS